MDIVTPYSIGALHRIEHRPQHVELELQDLERALLLLARAEMVERDREAMLDVAPRLRSAGAEVLQSPRVDPRIVLRPVRQAVLVDLRREQLGQRRAHRLLPRRAAREVHVGIDREAHARQHVLERVDAPRA